MDGVGQALGQGFVVGCSSIGKVALGDQEVMGSTPTFHCGSS